MLIKLGMGTLPFERLTQAVPMYVTDEQDLDVTTTEVDLDITTTEVTLDIE